MDAGDDRGAGRWKAAHVVLGVVLVIAATVCGYLALSAGGGDEVALRVATAVLSGSALAATVADLVALGRLRQLGVSDPPRSGRPDVAYISTLRIWSRSRDRT